MHGSANDRTHPNARDWQLRRLWDDSKWDGWAFCPLDKTHYHIRIGYCKTDYTRAQTHIRKPSKRLIRKPVANGSVISVANQSVQGNSVRVLFANTKAFHPLLAFHQFLIK